MQRGVFYTPRPVVSYIVRSVHELLRTEFGLEDGLADTTTWGEMASAHARTSRSPRASLRSRTSSRSSTPPLARARSSSRRSTSSTRRWSTKWKSEGHGEKKIETLWNEYVPKHLLPRLHGYELLMAPYAIAHLKVGLKLYETGYHFGADERARIYLTNALEPQHDFSDQFEFAIPALAHEAQAVNEVKRQQRFTVVIGNPPYSGVSSNMSAEAQALVDDYKSVDGKPLGERKLWLQDDYVKFMSVGQIAIDRTGLGVLGLITNHAYLDNPTFRGMRQSLARSFSLLRLLDLHGNASKRERSPDGSDDKNVFDIQQGVAIALAVRPGRARGVEHADLWGSRPRKYAWLGEHSTTSTAYERLSPDSPYYFFVHRDETGRDEFASFPSLQDVFPLSVSGIVTSRDAFVLDEDPNRLGSRICAYLDPAIDDTEAKAIFGLSENYAWRVSESRATLRKDGFQATCIKPILYRPFDRRSIYYHPAVVWRTRGDPMTDLLSQGNIGLISVRQVAEGEFNHVFVTDTLVESRVTLSNKGIAYCWPLRVRSPSDGDVQTELELQDKVNCSPTLISRLESCTGTCYSDMGSFKTSGLFGPLDVFGYVYAVLYSAQYRKRYSEFLKIDFPRVPLPRSSGLFRELARRGSQLVAAHLLEPKKVDRPRFAAFVGETQREVERVGWSDDTVWLNAAATKKGQPAKPGTSGFRGVPEEVWNFHIGGYQVCHKWLKDRKGRTLSDDDILHYQRIVVAISETIRLMKEIDEVIDAHGGWPDAFAAAVDGVDG